MSPISSNPLEVARQFALSRRDFIRSAAGVALGSSMLSSPITYAAAAMKKRKVVVDHFRRRRA